MKIYKFFLLGLSFLILSCGDIKVIVQKKTLETSLNLSNKVITQSPTVIIDSIKLIIVKNEFKNIVIDSIYFEDFGTRKTCTGFQYSLDSGNFGVAKFVESESIKLINFYNQLDIATENQRPSFTLYYFGIGKKTIVVNTLKDSRTILY